MNVYRDGKRYAHWPISTGRPGDDTPNGTYLSIEKGNPVEMVGEGYDIQVPYSVRITWSGVYLHAASWSVGSQGSTNVSHGCINMSPDAAAIYYAMSSPATLSPSPAARVPAPSTTAGPCGSSPGGSGGVAAPCTGPSAPARKAAASRATHRKPSGSVCHVAFSPRLEERRGRAGSG